MALYQYSWLILLSPLFAFAVIVFGTRMWDLLSRPRSGGGEALESVAAGHEHGAESHTAEDHAVVDATKVYDSEAEASEAVGDVHLFKSRGSEGERILEEEADPKV